MRPRIYIFVDVRGLIIVARKGEFTTLRDSIKINWRYLWCYFLTVCEIVSVRDVDSMGRLLLRYTWVSSFTTNRYPDGSTRLPGNKSISWCYWLNRTQRPQVSTLVYVNATTKCNDNRNDWCGRTSQRKHDIDVHCRRASLLEVHHYWRCTTTQGALLLEVQTPNVKAWFRWRSRCSTNFLSCMYHLERKRCTHACSWSYTTTVDLILSTKIAHCCSFQYVTGTGTTHAIISDVVSAYVVAMTHYTRCSGRNLLAPIHVSPTVGVVITQW